MTDGSQRQIHGRGHDVPQEPEVHSSYSATDDTAAVATADYINNV
jgi:hypothetical protein